MHLDIIKYLERILTWSIGASEYRKEKMKIGGLQKVSLIDYPGMISAIIFSQGCNFRCSYCHNPGLVDPDLFQPCMKEKDVLDFLQTRRGKLDAVAITGGEPTIQNNLMPFIKQIKKMGFAVKLDTNGSKPQVIKALLSEKLLDYIAMDIKAPLEKYEKIVNVSGQFRVNKRKYQNYFTLKNSV